MANDAAGYDGPMHIRPARPDDAETIADYNAKMATETEGLQLPPATVRAGVASALQEPHKARYFVAEIDGRVVGQLMITREWSDWRNGDIWWIQSVYVDADHRRCGVFRALYQHARTEARAAGAVALRLYVEQDNRAAQQTYTQLGMSLTHYLVMEEPIAKDS